MNEQQMLEVHYVDVVCVLCGMEGHRAKDCPWRKEYPVSLTVVISGPNATLLLRTNGIDMYDEVIKAIAKVAGDDEEDYTVTLLESRSEQT